MIRTILAAAALFATAAQAEPFAVSVTGATTEEGTVPKCRFTLEAKNEGDVPAIFHALLEHRIEPGTTSARIAPRNGAFGLEKRAFIADIPPGGSGTDRADFLGVVCDDLASVWVSPSCGPDCAVAAEGTVSVSVATADELAARAAPKPPGPLDGMWLVAAEDGTPLMSLSMTHEKGGRAKGSFAFYPGFCAMDRATCETEDGGVLYALSNPIVGNMVVVPGGEGDEQAATVAWMPDSGEGSISFGEDDGNPVPVTVEAVQPPGLN